MAARLKYRKKSDQYVIAVKLDLDIDALRYRKWGGVQRAKRGDWLVDNGGEVYTVDARVFARTYRRLRAGVYLKVTPVWAEVATRPGSVRTKEGVSHYERGDFLIYNRRAGGDTYCMTAAKFRAMYTRSR